MTLLNLVTYTLITAIAFALIVFLLRDTALNRKFNKTISTYMDLVAALSGKLSTIDLSSLPKNTQALARFLYVVKQEEGIETLSIRSNKLLLRTPLSQALPASPASPYRFVPAMLTTIGILGTFAGISIGLMDLDYGSRQSSAELLVSAKELLGGMKTAFITSLVGMFSALVFMLQLGMGAIRNDKTREQTELALAAISTYITANELLHGLSTEGQQELIKVQIEASKLSMQSQQAMQQSIGVLSDNLKNLNADNMAQAVGEAVGNATREELKPTLAKISEELKTLHEIKKENGKEVMEMVLNSMKKDIVEPLATQISAVIEGVERNNNTTRELSSTLENVAERLSATSEVLRRFQEDTMQKLQDFAGSLSSILNEFQSGATNVLETIALEIKNSMLAAKEGMEMQREAFAQSAEKAADAFADQNNQLKSVGEEAKQLMDSARENLTEGLSDIDAKVKSMSDVVQLELEQFRVEYQNNLQSFFERQSNLLETTLSEQRDGLAKVVGDFREVFVDDQNVRLKQRQELDSGEKVLRELNEAIQSTRASTLSQLDELATTLGKQVGLLRKSYEEASGRYVDMTEAMPKAMSEWFSKAKATQESFFGDFDEAAASVHRNLAEVAEILLVSATASHQLPASNEDSSQNPRDLIGA